MSPPEATPLVVRGTGCSSTGLVMVVTLRWGGDCGVSTDGPPSHLRGPAGDYLRERGLDASLGSHRLGALSADASGKVRVLQGLLQVRAPSPPPRESFLFFCPHSELVRGLVGRESSNPEPPPHRPSRHRWCLWTRFNGVVFTIDGLVLIFSAHWFAKCCQVFGVPLAADYNMTHST